MAQVHSALVHDHRAQIASVILDLIPTEVDNKERVLNDLLSVGSARDKEHRESEHRFALLR